MALRTRCMGPHGGLDNVRTRPLLLPLDPPSGVQQSQVHSRHALDCLHELTGGLLPPGKYPPPPCNGLTWTW
jgi:hypothetical protein